MLSFNEGKACDAVIRHLERRYNAHRSDVSSHDHHPHPDKRIELTFKLGSTLYAMEHTGIEPFPDFMRLNGESPRLTDRVIERASARLPKDEIFELHIPVGAFFGRKRHELLTIQDALVNFVVSSATTIPIRRYADYRRPQPPTPVMPLNVPFEVTLYRFRPGPGVAVEYNFMLRHNLPHNSEDLRIARMQIACDTKFPKLAAWKKTDNARTVLILEDNDLQLTNQALVTEIYLPIAQSRNDRPDETYLLITVTNIWYLCPILIDDQSYFDLANSDEESLFTVDPTDFDAITLR
jgi:hypothetical protein